MSTVDAATPAPVRPLADGQVGHWAWDTTTGELAWDDDCRALFDARPGEDPRTALRRTVPTAVAAASRPAPTPQHAVHALSLTRPDGSVRHLLSRVTAVGHEDGAGEPRTAPRWMRGVVIDVTSLHDRSARAHLALQSLADPFIALDREQHVLYVNPAAEEVFGAPASALLGRRVPGLDAGRLADDSHLVAVRRALASSEPSTVEVQSAGGRWFECRVHPTTEGHHLFIRDCTQRRATAVEQARLVTELARQAATDRLTGLDNGTRLRTRLDAHLSGRSTATATVLFLDLDRFKLVNDTLGHSTGDDLLRAVADRLREAAGPGAVVSRLGGDEFVVLLLDLAPGAAEEVARRVLASFEEPVLVRGRQLRTATSIGLASGAHGTSGEKVLRDADAALYSAKEAGRGRLAWYDQRLHDDVLRRVGLENDLRRSLADARPAGAPPSETDELRLHFQPSFSLASGHPTGAEALLRWHHARRGLVPPAEVIPVAEESRLIVPLGQWVMASAVAQARTWSAVPDFTTWLNVSPQQLASGEVVDTLVSTIIGSGLPPHRLGIEVTEQALADGSPAVRALEGVHDLGIKIAIDDFGTGFSWLSRLLSFPVDVLKIDRSFVRAAGAPQRTPAAEAVLRSIVDLAHGLGASVIAEGVETWAELAALKATACDSAAGYLLARPQPAHQLTLARVPLSPPRAGGTPDGALDGGATGATGAAVPPRGRAAAR